MAGTGSCEACGYSPVAIGAVVCPKCGKSDPNPGAVANFVYTVLGFLVIIGVVIGIIGAIAGK